MTDREIAKITGALTHPIRISFLRTLRADGMLSPVQFSRESGQPLGNVSYHVQTLKKSGVLKVAESVPKRGAMEHRYSLDGDKAGSVLAVLDLLEAI